MNKLSVVICLLILLIAGCANSSFLVPIGKPVVLKGGTGGADQKCQIVIENGKPKTDCADMLVMNQ